MEATIVKIDFDKVKEEEKQIDKLIEIKSNPIAKSVISLFKAIPVVAEFVDSCIDTELFKHQVRKREELLAYVFDEEELITSERVNDIEFIMSFAKTIEVVDRLSVNDKIEYMGKLLKRGYFSGEKIENYQFDEYLCIIRELSYREIEILVLYDKYMGRLGKKISSFQNVWEFVEFKKIVKNRFDISDNVIVDMLNKLQSKGLCIFEVASYYIDEKGYTSFTTDYFKELKEFIV
jgi:hypothetical protein